MKLVRSQKDKTRQKHPETSKAEKSSRQGNQKDVSGEAVYKGNREQY